MNQVTLHECQRIVDEWIKTVGVRYFSELTNLAQLMEEVGEVARIMSRNIYIGIQTMSCFFSKVLS